MNVIDCIKKSGLATDLEIKSVDDRIKVLESEGKTKIESEVIAKAEFVNTKYSEIQQLQNDLRKSLGLQEEDIHKMDLPDLDRLKQDFNNKKNELQAMHLSEVEKIKNNKKVNNGRITTNRLSKAEERGRDTSGEENAAVSIVLSRVHQAIGDKYGDAVIDPQELNKEEEKSIEEYSKNAGTWHENASTDFGNVYDKGQENEVFLDQKNTTIVTKLNDASLSENWLDVMDKIALHNTYFPEAPYELIGFGRNAKGDLVAITKQPFVQGVKPSENEIIEAMKDKGFEPLVKYDKSLKGTVEETKSFIDKKHGVVVEDVHRRNAIKDKDGHVIIIDPLISLDTQDKGYGGNRQIGHQPVKNQEIQKQPIFQTRLIENGMMDPNTEDIQRLITAIEQRDAFINAVLVVDSVAGDKYKNSTQEQKFYGLFHDFLDYNNGEYRNNQLVKKINNPLQDNYILFAIADRIRKEYDKLSSKGQVEKWMLDQINSELINMSTSAGYGLKSFDANFLNNISGNDTLGFQLLPPNLLKQKDTTNESHGDKPDGSKKTLIEEATDSRDKSREIVENELNNPMSGLSSTIDRLLDEIRQKDEEIEALKNKISSEKQSSRDLEKIVGRKREDALYNRAKEKYNKAIELLQKGNIGFAYDPKQKAKENEEILSLLFSSAVDFAYGSVLKAKRIFKEFLDTHKIEVDRDAAWEKYSQSEDGKKYIEQVKKEWAIDKLTKMTKKKSATDVRDDFDRIFDILKNSKKPQLNKAAETLEELIKRSYKELKLSQEYVTIVGDAINLLSAMNYDESDQELYQKRQEKIDELYEFLDILSEETNFSPESKESRSRRNARAIVSKNLKDRGLVIRDIIKDWIKYGGTRYALSDRLSDVLLKEDALEMEKRVFAELDNMAASGRVSISKNEKRSLQEQAQKLKNKLEDIQQKRTESARLTNELDIINQKLSKENDPVEISSLKAQKKQVLEKIENITESSQDVLKIKNDPTLSEEDKSKAIDKLKEDNKNPRKALIRDAKETIDFLKKRNGEDDHILIKHQEELIKMLEANEPMHKIVEAIKKQISDELKSIAEEKVKARASESRQARIEKLNEKLEQIRNGTYTRPERNVREEDDEIKSIKQQIADASGARSMLDSVSNRFNAEKLVKAIKMGAMEFGDFMDATEDAFGGQLSPEQRKHINSLGEIVKGITRNEAGAIENGIAMQKALAIIRNIRGQLSTTFTQRAFYGIFHSWAYDSMLSGLGSVINSAYGAFSGYTRIIAEGAYRALNKSDRKAFRAVMSKMIPELYTAISMAKGTIAKRGEIGLTREERNAMSGDIFDRIYQDYWGKILKEIKSEPAKAVSKLFVKSIITPVKHMLNVFSATDVYNRHIFRSWNESWDAFDKLKEKNRYDLSNSNSILQAINDELGFKESIITQAKSEAATLGFSGMRAREFVNKRVLELREKFINDVILVSHADHTARKMLMIGNPESELGARFYNMTRKADQTEAESTLMGFISAAFRNMISPFSRNLVNYTHKYIVNTTIPFSMAANAMGIKYVGENKIFSNLLTQQYSNYQKYLESKAEYDKIFAQWEIEQDPNKAASLKKQLDNWVMEGIAVYKGGEITTEPYTKRDMWLDFFDSILGIGVAAAIYMMYDDGENEEGDQIKMPNKIRFCGSGKGLTYSEQTTKNYVPYSIQIKDDQGNWRTVAKWNYLFAHPAMFWISQMTDSYYNKNSNWGRFTDAPLGDALSLLATAPLSQNSQQGLQTMVDILRFAGDFEEKYGKSPMDKMLESMARQTIAPNFYTMTAQVFGWMNDKEVKFHQNPILNQMIRMSILGDIGERTRYSATGLKLKQPFPIQVLEWASYDQRYNGNDEDIIKLTNSLSELNINGALNFYNPGENLSDDKEGDVVITGLPEKYREDIRQLTAETYGKLLVEEKDRLDPTEGVDDFKTTRKVLQEQSAPIFEYAKKYATTKVLIDYIDKLLDDPDNQGDIDEWQDFYSDLISWNEEIPSYTASFPSPIKPFKDYGIRIIDGKIKKIKNLDTEKAVKALELINK